MTVTDPSAQELAASSVVAQANSNAASSGPAIGATLAQTGPMKATTSMKIMKSMKAKNPMKFNKANKPIKPRLAAAAPRCAPSKS